MHHFAVTPQAVLLPSSMSRRLRQALADWGQRQWLALCLQAERPTRRVPYC